MSHVCPGHAPIFFKALPPSPPVPTTSPSRLKRFVSEDGAIFAMAAFGAMASVAEGREAEVKISDLAGQVAIGGHSLSRAWRKKKHEGGGGNLCVARFFLEGWLQHTRGWAATGSDPWPWAQDKGGMRTALPPTALPVSRPSLFLEKVSFTQTFALLGRPFYSWKSIPPPRGVTPGTPCMPPCSDCTSARNMKNAPRTPPHTSPLFCWFSAGDERMRPFQGSLVVS